MWAAYIVVTLMALPADPPSSPHNLSYTIYKPTLEECSDAGVSELRRAMEIETYMSGSYSCTYTPNFDSQSGTRI